MESASTSSVLTIRGMRNSDAANLWCVVDLSFSKFMGFFAKLSIEEKGQTLVAEVSDTIIGFAKLTKFSIGGRKFGCILWIAVHPKFRRKGVASALTDKGIIWLKKDCANAVFASTQRSNKNALRVLNHRGFRVTGFLDLWSQFGWRVFQLYREIWLAPGEVVLMHV